MKLKHFQGYGSVEAKKVSKTTTTHHSGINVTTLVIEVKGNHEYGIEVNDESTVWRWLVKRFDKGVGEVYDYVVNVVTDDDYVRENGLDVEVCKYTIKYYKRF